MDPITIALAGLLAYRTYQGQGKLAEWIGHKGPNADPAMASGAPGQQLPPLLQQLGAAPLAQGLNDLLKDFQQKGFGETIKSWIETGPNKAVSIELEQALGPDKIAWLMQQTGLSREALLAGLSRELPSAVDQLTPDGRLPTNQEAMHTSRSTSAPPGRSPA